MKKISFAFALLVAGLITFAAPSAQAQSVGFGVSIGTSHGGVSVHVGNGPYRGGYYGGYYHRHYPGYGHDYGYYRPAPRYDYPSTRQVLVYETQSGWVYNRYTGRNEWRQWTTERWVTAYWSNYYGCYGYTDRYGSFRCLR